MPVHGRIGGLAVTRPVLARMQTLHATGRPNIPGTVLDASAADNQALESFFVEHEEKAFYVAYAALWDREAAMDAVQDSMLRLVQYYRHKPASEWPALFRTILNSRINDVRRRRMIEQGKHKLVSLTGLFRGNRDDERDDCEYELPAADRDDGITAPEVEYIAGELREQVERALQSLSERQRQVFILREWRGMSIGETAATLGCSENSIKQHHFRAMRELRKQLAEVWENAQPTAS
jgi:RNA polymerase sigma-70 factor (ECF subfamily)